MGDLVIDVASVLDAVGEPSRRRLLDLLHVQHESTVTEQVDTSGMCEPQVSKRLKISAEVGLVEARADGRSSGGGPSPDQGVRPTNAMS